jgi:hypothetical protein
MYTTFVPVINLYLVDKFCISVKNFVPGYEFL